MPVVPIKDKSGKDVILYQKSYALIIGVSDYTNGWPDFPGVKKDVSIVSDALTRQGFNVVIISDPAFQKMKEAFDSFINSYGQDEDNRLLFYFAGHGHTTKQS